MTNVVIEEMEFEGLPGPLSGTRIIDGAIWVSIDGTRHILPIGEEIPKDGLKNHKIGGWWWNGDESEPTIRPSVNLSDAHFHITNGKIEHVE